MYADVTLHEPNVATNMFYTCDNGTFHWPNVAAKLFTWVKIRRTNNHQVFYMCDERKKHWSNATTKFYIYVMSEKKVIELSH